MIQAWNLKHLINVIAYFSEIMDVYYWHDAA